MAGEIVGIDATASHLFAQVRSGKPEMKVDDENRLRHLNWPEGKTSIYVGDVTEAIIRCFGPHEPPILTTPPGFDQQSWSMVLKDSTMRVEIISKSYWGFGLFDSCFLNQIHIEGPLERRTRLIFDLVASLGRNPWEGKFGLMWKRTTKAGSEEHRHAWEGLITHAREQMSEEAHAYSDRLEKLHSKFPEFDGGDYQKWDRGGAEEAITNAKNQIEIARAALHDNNAAGFERALARAEAALIEADPTTEVERTVFDEAEDLLLEDSLTIDEDTLVEQILVHEELPEEVERLNPEVVATETSNVSADDLFSEMDDVEDEVPFVDLTESEE